MIDALPWLPALLGLVIALAAVAVNWGIFKARLDAQERHANRIQTNADRIPTVEAQLSKHEARQDATDKRVDHLCAIVERLRQHCDKT